MENIKHEVRSGAFIFAVNVRAIIATLGGRTVAIPEAVAIYLLVDDGHTGYGRLRYLTSDTVAIDYGNAPANHVWEYPIDRCRPSGGGIALAALRAFLATGPEPSCNLDEVDPSTALVVHREPFVPSRPTEFQIIPVIHTTIADSAS